MNDDSDLLAMDSDDMLTYLDDQPTNDHPGQ